ncbi:MAG: MarR family transcriptional regulator [Paludibacter sp.]
MIENDNVSIDSVIENLISIHPLLSKTFTKSIRSKTNLNPGSLYVLGVLTRHDTLSMTEIGCRLSMPKSHVTSLVDKLIAEEMVERLFDPKDRRIVNVKITEKGLTDFCSIKQEISQELRLKLEKLDAERLSTLSVATQQVKDILMTVVVEPSSCNSTDSCKEK